MGYHKIELDEQSKEFTIFVTHTGLYRYKRLMFGVSAAPEIYQHLIQQSPRLPRGVKYIRQHVFEKTRQEHDHNPNTVLARVKERDLTPNGDKCKFGVPEITSFGHTISANDISPTDETDAAIRNAQKSSNASEVSCELLQPAHPQFPHHSSTTSRAHTQRHTIHSD